MKHRNKKLLLISMLVCTFLLIACKNVKFNTFKDPDKVDEDINTYQSGTDEDNDTGDEQNDKKDDGLASKEVRNSSESKEEPTPTVIQPVANTELMIYTINSDGYVETTTALIPQDAEVTPQLIVETVVDTMADNDMIVGIESVTTENDAVIVSFYKDQPPLNVGSGYETAILDAIAMSLIENMDGRYSKVIYRVEGEAYISGHIERGLNEAYLLN